MPIYEYRCENGHTFDVLQSFSDDPVRDCEECGAPCERVLHPVAVHFKGSGFYSTDYAGRGKATDSKDGKDAASGDSGSKEKSESKSESSSNGSGGESKAKAGSDSD